MANVIKDLSGSTIGTCNDIKGSNLTFEEALVAIKAILDYRRKQNG